ncbi:hypothetical protein SUGI_0997550 [Cryptomeria japonica]|uniref:probable WRKY transcription factor 47 n=1 Tax=Cryptomeria japonica TaxID=3369 RepID=UPI002414CE8B|nr:probable WRKY transcription factor 47 [Cryptomeria japonica]GLJ47252.1 hypothetical protein SUGI_0997550 [Cryptomeria japonica]
MSKDRAFYSEDCHKNELVAELRRLGEENQKLKSMIHIIRGNYQGLQTQLTKKQEEYLRSFPSSLGRDLTLGTDVAEETNNEGHGHQATDHSGDSSAAHSESSQEKKSKSSMENDRLPSKKRKVNYELDQSTNGESNSYEDISLPNKKPHVATMNSDYPKVPLPKKIVTVRTRSETTTVNDGCQWRKYGQKTTRNSLWPRAYYKCAVSSCPVKKQVQRCTEDPGIVSTTYEGDHNHLLSPVAMAAMTATTNERGEGLTRGNELPFHPSIATISSMGSSPTITLDFTDNPIPASNPNQLPNPASHPIRPQVQGGSFSQFPSSLYNSNTNYSQLGFDPVASIKSDPNFAAALAAAVASSILQLGATSKG